MSAVVHYVGHDGEDYFDQWLRNQSSDTRARIQTRIDRIELGNLGDHRSVGKGVFELRSHFGAGYRVYFGRDGEALVILLGGGPRGGRAVTSQSHSSGGMHTDRRNEMPVKSHKASDYLNTQEDIVAYLNAAVEEMGDDPRLLMKAFRNVAEARGGVSEVARQAKMDRVALSRALSGQRIPRLDTLTKVSAACGVRLRFSASTFR